MKLENLDVNLRIVSYNTLWPIKAMDFQSECVVCSDMCVENS